MNIIFKWIESSTFGALNDDFKIEVLINCEFFNRNDEVVFLETEVKVSPLWSGIISRPVCKELGMRLSESIINIKSAFEFERSLLISKYEVLLKHRHEHPEAYVKQDQEDKGNKIDLEKDWRKYCC